MVNKMNDTKKIRILVADDHAITRDGLRTLISLYDDFDLISEAANGKEAVDLCRELCPDVVLMDLEMPVLGGIEAIKEIKKHNPETKIIALSSFADNKLVKDTIKAGALSYIIKNVSTCELAGCIRDARNGKSCFSPEVTAVMVSEINSPSSGVSVLTEKERDILIMIAGGYSNKAIAKELFVSDNTVKFHISNILSKLGVANRAQAAAIAVKENLLD